MYIYVDVDIYASSSQIFHLDYNRSFTVQGKMKFLPVPSHFLRLFLLSWCELRYQIFASGPQHALQTASSNTVVLRGLHLLFKGLLTRHFSLSSTCSYHSTNAYLASLFYNQTVNYLCQGSYLMLLTCNACCTMSREGMLIDIKDIYYLNILFVEHIHIVSEACTYHSYICIYKFKYINMGVSI